MNFYVGTKADEAQNVKGFFAYLEKITQNKQFAKFLIRVKRSVLADGKTVDGLIEKYKKLGIDESMLTIAVDNSLQKKTFSENELENLKRLEAECAEKGVQFGVLDFCDVYSSKQVENAQKTIVQMANDIKKFDYSPIEKLLQAYLMIAKRIYKVGDTNDSISKSRSVYGVLNGDKIVCAGYSELLRAVLDEVGDENLRVFQNNVGLLTGNKVVLHQNNMVYIDDKKYGEKGYYMTDLTKDANQIVGKKIFSGNLNSFLINMSNIKNIKTESYVDYYQAYNYLMQRINPYLIADKQNGTSMDIKPRYSSVCSTSARIKMPQKKQETAQETFGEFLAKDKNIKDFALKQVLGSQAENEEGFDEMFEMFAQDIYQNPQDYVEGCKPSALFEFLKEHSKEIDFASIMGALRTVLKNQNPTWSKDRLSKEVYAIFDRNAYYSKYYFKQDSTMPFRECHTEE